MTKKQFKTLTDAIHESFPETKVKGQLIVFPPTGEILKGVVLDRRSSPTQFKLLAIFMPLCIPSKHITLNFQRVLGGIHKTWDYHEPNLHEQLIAAIHAEALPYFEQFATTELACQFVMESVRQVESGLALRASGYLLALLGDYPGAIGYLERYIPRFNTKIEWQAIEKARTENLVDLLKNDPEQALWQLREWRRQTIGNLEIGSLIGE
jgi:hypothetical protein